jgi:hypothetical protein
MKKISNPTPPDGKADIIFAEAYNGSFGPELLARTIATRPPNEDRIRGLA